jgi:ATP-dependent DNA helicase RecG
LIERARHILAHEQRSGHQDNVVKPGGIEAFIERWTTQMRDARDRGEIAAPPAGATGRFPEVAILHLLTGYRALDPMQRAAKIRAALALLDAFDTPNAPAAARQPRPATAPAPGQRPRGVAPRFGQSANGHASKRPADSAPEDDWPLAKPLPKPPI